MLKKITGPFYDGIPYLERKATSQIPIRSGSFLDFALQGGERISPSKAISFYEQNSAIATAVDLIATSLEQIKPVLQTEDGKFTSDNDVIMLLRNPNGFETWKEFIGSIARYYLITSNSYITALGNVKRPPLEIFSSKPQNITVTENHRDTYPDKYMLTMGAGVGTYSRRETLRGITRFYDGNLKEIYHIMGFSSRNNNIQGDSPLNAAALEARQQIKGKTHNLQLLNNGGRLSLIVAFKDESLISREEHQSRKKRIREDLGGDSNAGSIAVISAPEVNVTEASQSNRDMDYANLDEMSRNAIYLRYKIPLPLVTLNAATFDNFGTSILSLYDQATLPLAEVIFAGLSKMLLPRFGIDNKKSRITYDPESITALMARRLIEIEKRTALNLETKNELRGLLPNRDDIEGGDVIYQPSQMIPLGTDITQNTNTL